MENSKANERIMNLMSFVLDELQLSTELTEDANNAAASPSEKVNKEAMYFGILINRIIPGATVLGFSRSGNFTNKQFLDRKSEVYTLVDVDMEDIQETIQNHAKDPKQMESTFNQIVKTGLKNQILFFMKILEHQELHFEKITSATDIFLIILHGNLAFHNKRSDTGFSEMLKGRDIEFLKNTFKLCKENLQSPGGIGEECDNRADVFVGTLTDEEIWESDVSRIKMPFSFLESVGIFDIPPSSYGTITMTAQHLSFVEFFASVGIILSSENIEAELNKIENDYRARAVCYYIWNELLFLYYYRYIRYFRYIIKA